MGSELVFDMKLSLATLTEIGEEYKGNSEVISALKIVVEETKKAIITQGSVERGIDGFTITKLFGLNRSLVVLSLIRNVNAFGPNDPTIESAFAVIMPIVEEKIKVEREKERGLNEKNSRR